MKKVIFEDANEKEILTLEDVVCPPSLGDKILIKGNFYIVYNRFFDYDANLLYIGCVKH